MWLDLHFFIWPCSGNDFYGGVHSLRDLKYNGGEASCFRGQVLSALFSVPFQVHLTSASQTQSSFDSLDIPCMCGVWW